MKYLSLTAYAAQTAHGIELQWVWNTIQRPYQSSLERRTFATSAKSTFPQDLETELRRFCRQSVVRSLVVTVDDNLGRYFSFQRPEGTRDHAELKRVAAAEFVRRFQLEESKWQISLHLRARQKGCVCFAIERERLLAWQGIARTNGYRLLDVAPQFVRAINRVAPNDLADGLYSLRARTGFVIGRVDGAQLQSIRVHRASGASLGEIVAREELLAMSQERLEEPSQPKLFSLAPFEPLVRHFKPQMYQVSDLNDGVVSC